MSALDTQVAGDHYKKYKIQPVEFAMGNNLNLCQANVVKYVVRYKEKGGKDDLLKARHYIDLLLEFEYGEGQIEPNESKRPEYLWGNIRDVRLGHTDE